VGDFFGVLGKTATGKIGWNREYDLNSAEDFYVFKKKHPEITNIRPAQYTYLTGMELLEVNTYQNCLWKIALIF